MYVSTSAGPGMSQLPSLRSFWTGIQLSKAAVQQPVLPDECNVLAGCLCRLRIQTREVNSEAPDLCWDFKCSKSRNVPCLRMLTAPAVACFWQPHAFFTLFIYMSFQHVSSNPYLTHEPQPQRFDFAKRQGHLDTSSSRSSSPSCYYANIKTHIII